MSPIGSDGRPSFRDPSHDGTGLVVVNEQVAMLGGMERIVAAILDRWPAAELVAPRFLGEDGPSLFPEARHIDLPGRRDHHLTPLHLRRLARAPRLRGDVVLALHSTGWGLGLRTAPGVPVVAYTNGIPRWTGPLAQYYVRERVWPVRAALLGALPLQRALQRRVRRRADVLLACSSAAARTLPGPGAPRVVHPPVDVARFAGSGDPAGHVLAVGRLVAHKRFDLVVEAVRGSSLSLVVVGTGAEGPALERAAPPNVRFAGPVDDDELVSLLHDARALVHPNPEEFGLVMAEALAAGVPVVAPRAGGALDIVEDGVTGRLLDVVTTATIRDALESLVPDPEACRERAARFSTERFAQEMGEALDTACGRGAPQLAAV